jgi:hypothetical protein
VFRSFGGEREGVDGEGDDDFARGGVGFSLVVLVSYPDHLRREGLEEPLAESDCRHTIHRQSRTSRPAAGRD